MTRRTYECKDRKTPPGDEPTVIDCPPETPSLEYVAQVTDCRGYAPNHKACMRDEFRKPGIMGIDGNDIGDLKSYDSKEAVKKHLKEKRDPNCSCKNIVHRLQLFAHDIKNGDIIFVKKDMHKIIEKGVVTSDYIYGRSRKNNKHIGKANRTDIGEWEHTGNAAMKL